MKKRYLIAAGAMLFFVLLVSFRSFAGPFYLDRGRLVTDSWVEENGSTYRTDHMGRKVTGKAVMGGDTYLFDGKGRMATGWQGREYYMPDVKAALGWTKTGGSSYYFTKEGMRTGWFRDGERTFYLGTDGKLTKGWRMIDGFSYCFGEDGAMLTGWQDRYGDRCLLSEDGRLLTGPREYEGSLYRLDREGRPMSGWYGRYFFEEDGVAASGWTRTGGKDLYFGEDHLLRTGLFEADGNEYFLEEDGTISPGRKDGLYVCGNGLGIRDRDLGSFGRLVVPALSIDVRLFAADSRADYQPITDEEDSALVVMERHDMEPVISDRRSQGFDLNGGREGMDAYIQTEDGVFEYTCVGKSKGINEGRDVTDPDGKSLWNQNEDGFCTYSSAGTKDNSEVTVLFWRLKEI